MRASAGLHPDVIWYLKHVCTPAEAADFHRQPDRVRDNPIGQSEVFYDPAASHFLLRRHRRAGTEMSASKAQTATKTSRSRRARGSIEVASRRVLREPAYLVRNNRPTHVLLRIDEYEELLRAREAHELIAKLEDPNTKWVPVDQAMMEIVGSWLAQARKKAGLTQKQLADRLRVPQSQISRIEKNPDRTTLRTMKRIAAALGVEVGELLSSAQRRR
jgi:DNA-binding XRE family transcriptional regulator